MKNTLYTNDNLFILNGMNSESVDLIYLDPPFNSKRTYSAPIGSKSAGASFKDMWSWDDVNKYYLEKMLNDYPFLVGFIKAIKGIHGKPMMSYITYMTQRIIEMHRVLKATGSLYLHVDPTASHYLKIVLDHIFGKNNFRNEIVWCYTGPSNTKRYFPRKHDCLFFYVKNAAGHRYTFNGSDIKIPYAKLNTGQTQGIFKTSATLDAGGKIPEDWWEENRDGVTPVGRIKSERTGYPTQKPLALLHRIIAASSNKGDVVFDPFCGCATACVAAQQLERKWIGIDIEEQAASVLVERLSDDAGFFKDFVHRLDIPKRTDVKQTKHTLPVKKRLYNAQKGICNGCKRPYHLKDFHIDHVVPTDKGGGDYYENYQLLCGHCNSTKGNRPMEYLLMKIKMREELFKESLTFGD